jgi:hypothetical protein
MREYCLDPEECAFMGYVADASPSSYRTCLSAPEVALTM